MHWHLSLKRQQLAATATDTPPAVLARLVRSPHKRIAEAAAANPSLPEGSIVEAVSEAIQHRHDDLLAKLASNPSLHADSMSAIILRGTERCLWALVQNPSLPADLIREIIPRGSGRCLTMLMYHQNLPVDLMLKYIRGAGSACLSIIAEHPDADLTVLTAIYNKVIGRRRSRMRDCVLWAVLEHSACSIDLIRGIYEAGVWLPIAYLERSDLPPDIIDEIFEWQQLVVEHYTRATHRDDIEYRREAEQAASLIASHPNTSLSVLTVIAMGPKPWLASKALDNLQRRREADPALFDRQAAA